MATSPAEMLVKAPSRLQVVLREEHPEWLEGHRALYEYVLAADSEDAEQAIRWMADEARAFLPRIADARRVLLVAAPGKLSAMHGAYGS